MINANCFAHLERDGFSSTRQNHLYVGRVLISSICLSVRPEVQPSFFTTRFWI